MLVEQEKEEGDLQLVPVYLGWRRELGSMRGKSNCDINPIMFTAIKNQRLTGVINFHLQICLIALPWSISMLYKWLQSSSVVCSNPHQSLKSILYKTKNILQYSTCMNSMILVVLLNSGGFDSDLPIASEILNLLICHDLLTLKPLLVCRKIA